MTKHVFPNVQKVNMEMIKKYVRHVEALFFVKPVNRVRNV